MKELIDKLNDAQREAVLTTEGPVMVMAGAGSGKTRVLTLRIAHLVNDCGIPPYNILAVTFTNKAAREMKERISNYIDVNINQMWVSTFHSICSRILRMEIEAIEGYNHNFNIIDEEDACKIIKEEISELNLDSKEYKPKLVKSKISALKNDMLLSFDDNNLKLIYDRYQRRLKHENLLDFDDLIILTIEVFENNPNILKKYQNKFLYIMIDEFQDTNTKQYNLIKLLGKANNNVFIVGDQDQSIYSFRGAKIENIDKFTSDFKNTKVIMLEENYRSTQKILDIANRVIDNNPNRYKKNLFTNKAEGEKPGYYPADSSYDEVMFVIDKIKELKTSGYSYNDFAIMYRANSISRNFEDAFVKYKIPYIIYGGISFFQRKEIKDMIAYLRLIVNHSDDFSLKRIINEPKRKIGAALLSKLSDKALEYNVSLFDAIDYLDRKGQGYTSLLDFKFKIIELLDDLNNEENDITKIIDIILEKTGYYDMLKELGEEGNERLDNVRELKTVIKEADEFYEGTRIDKINALLSDLALRTDTDNVSESNDRVKLMTFHQAKGLEYPVVFLVAFEQGIFPSNNCFSAFEFEEERRICYVGITRAKEKLFITNCRSRFLYGMHSVQFPSMFMNEIGLNNVRNLSKYSKKEFISDKPIDKPRKNVSEI
ncbi:MAG: ATP-dependent helicase, partial [Anaeroplasmataceae bacterium]